MSFKKIITHGARFHADEILAIATIFHFQGKMEVVRKFKIEPEEINNKDIIIVDVGRIYDTQHLNFDHHQSVSLAASNILVLDHFCKDENIKAYLKKHLYHYISEVDLGNIKEMKSDKEFFIPSFSSLIRNLNQYPDGFERALSLASEILDLYVSAAEKSKAGELKWKTLLFKKAIAIQHDTDEITNWKEWAERDGIMLLISPNNRGGYQIISRDSDLLVIPEYSSQTFRHNSGFLAVYPSFEEALLHAEAIIIKDIND